MTQFAEQRSDAWHQQRVGRVTGSIAGGILGVSPYMTRKDAMRSMVRAALGEPSEFETNPAVMHGNFYESYALEAYEERSCFDVTPTGFHEYDTWLGASPDGLVEGAGVLEIKCPFHIRKDPNPKFKSVYDMPHYFAQAQLELLCTGRFWLHFFQYVPPLTDRDGAVVRESKDRLETVMVDHDWRTENLPLLHTFHEEYLHELQHNPDDYRNPLRVEVNTPDAHRAVAEYDQLVEAIANAEERKKELLLDIAAMTNEQDGLIAGRKLTRVNTTSVLYKNALEHYAPNADLKAFKGKSSSYWKLS